MSTAADILSLYAPAVAALPTASAWIVDARERLSACGWGPNYERAVALLAAHNATLSITRPLGESGSVQSKSEGDLSLSFGSTGSGGSDWDQTYFGKQLLALRKSSNVAIGVTGGLDRGCGLTAVLPCP